MKCSKTSSSSKKGVCILSYESFTAAVLTKTEVVEKITSVLEKLVNEISIVIEEEIDSSSNSKRMRELNSQLQQFKLLSDEVNNTNIHTSIRRLDYSFGCYYELIPSTTSYKGTFIDSNRVVISNKNTHGCNSHSFDCLMHVRQVYDISDITHDYYGSDKYTLTLQSINKKLSGLEFSQYDIDYYRSYYKCNVCQRFYTYEEISDLCSEIRYFALNLFDSVLYNTIIVTIKSSSCSVLGLSISNGKIATPTEINKLVSSITIVSHPLSSTLVTKTIKSDQITWDLNAITIKVYYLQDDLFASVSISSSSSSSIVKYANYTMIGSNYFFTIPGSNKVCQSSTLPFLFYYDDLPCSEVLKSGNRLKTEIMKYISAIYGNVINLIENGVSGFISLEDDVYIKDNNSSIKNPITFLIIIIIIILL